MGFVVLHIDKASGNDAGMTAHIERTIDPANADKERTHLNRKLIEFPEGVDNRTQAIQHRLDNAGLTRKIGTNQVRALRIMLSGTPEDMQRIEAAGKLGEWCDDNLAWLRKTYGSDNVVSAVLHMDEKTPHIHATVVPIVTGERRKAQAKPAEPGKKQYRKKNANASRLCADDVMTRENLKLFQDTYAEAMAKYGLKRGIDGSKAKHTTNQEYYRELFVQKDELQEYVEVLQEQKTEINEKIRDLYDRKDEAREKFLNMHDHVQQKQMELSTVEIRLEQANRELDPNSIRADLNLIRELFPHMNELLKWAKHCLKIGFSKEDTVSLVNGEPIDFAGSLYSHEYQRKFQTQQSTVKLEQNPKEVGKFRLLIDELHIVDWFRQKQREFLKMVGVERQQYKGIKR